MIRRDDPGRWLLVLPEAALAVLCVTAFRLAAHATGLMQWPHDPDLYRDAAAAQRLLDCRCLADPLYRGETLWYNPLVPAIVAALSAMLHVPVHILYARAGPVLNLVPLAGFYTLARVSFGRLTAGLATFAFLFLVDPAAPAWASASYSPWLFAGVFTQGLFYLTLALHQQARHREGLAWNVAVGAGVGLTFLGHSAPALLLGTVLALDALVSGGPLRARLRGLAIEAVTAAAVAAPLLYSVVWRYRLRELNPMPSDWAYPAHLVDMMPSIPLGSLWITGSFLCAGLFVAGFAPDVKRRAASVWLWGGANIAWLAYRALLAPGAARWLGVHPPLFVPAFHFVFYLRAFTCLLAAAGLTWAIERAAAAAARDRLARSAVTATLALLVILVAYRDVGRDYADKHDLAEARSAAWRMSYRTEEQAAFDWVRHETRPGDVILASERAGLFVVGPAGRNVVLVDGYFSNPFVDLEARRADWHALWTAARRGDRQAFEPLAARYGVAYILVDDRAAAADLDRAAGCFARKRMELGDVRIYQVAPAPGCG
jgi:hypothetical protein